jgi:hypothetical protein
MSTNHLGRQAPHFRIPPPFRPRIDLGEASAIFAGYIAAINASKFEHAADYRRELLELGIEVLYRPREGER